MQTSGLTSLGPSIISMEGRITWRNDSGLEAASSSASLMAFEPNLEEVVIPLPWPLAWQKSRQCNYLCAMHHSDAATQ